MWRCVQQIAAVADLLGAMRSFQPLLSTALLTCICGTARADDSATLPTAINLPEGPASIEGFGQGHEVSPATGLPTLTYDLELPPGRAGLTPELSLRYAPGGGAGLLGLGWSLGLPAVELSTRRGIPAYDGREPAMLLGFGRGEELVEDEPGRFRQAIEGERPIEVLEREGGGLRALLANGTAYELGTTVASRVEGAQGVFRWELDAIQDPFGNRIELAWRKLDGTDTPVLDTISYNDGEVAVRFVYEPRPDAVRSSRSGRRLVLRHRLSEIRTEVDAETVRTYTLGYETSPTAPSTRLSSIACEARDGSRLPTWRLTYGELPEGAAATVLEDAPSVDPTAPTVAWVDVDGDALPDLLEGIPGAFRFRRNLAGRRLEQWRDLEPSPSVALGPHTRFADVNGDGVLDLLARVDEGTDGIRTYLGGGPSPYSEATEVPLEVSFGLDDPRVALVDVNLDGRVDVLRSEGNDAFVWQRARDGGGYAEMAVVPPLPAGMDLVDPGVSLADMDGDRIVDLVRVLPETGSVWVARGDGGGHFADPVELVDVPPMEPTDRWEVRDVNGDGAADLVRIGRTGLGLWTNRLDSGFTTARTTSWDEVGDDEAVLLSDVNGNGTVDVLRAGRDGGSWRYWDLLGQRPGLLSRLENGLGYSVELEYGTAAEQAARDESAGDPWTTLVPTGTPVLDATIEEDGTGWIRVTRHRVRDGWYDPERGELRGFARVEELREGGPYAGDRLRVRTFDLGREEPALRHQLLVEEIGGEHGVLRRDVYELTVDEPAPGVRVARRIASDRWHLEGGSQADAARVRTEYSHDEWGNVVEQRELGQVDPATGLDLPGDERITIRTFAAPVGDGPHDLVATVQVRDGEGELVSSTKRFYDGPPEQGLPLGEVERGSLRREAVWIEGDQWVDASRRDHDGFGNVVSERDAEGGVVLRTYDAQGLFPIEEVMPLDERSEVEALVVRADWDARTGKPTRLVDAAGAEHRVVYDGLGRPVALIEPGDTQAMPTTAYHYALDGSVPPAITTELRSRSGEDAVEVLVEHLDGMGRLRQRVTQNDDASGAVVAKALFYDVDGAVALELAGHPAGIDALGPGGMVDLDETWPSTRRIRDALGRVVEATFADGRRNEDVYSPLVRVHRDHEDLALEPPYQDSPRRFETDGLGRVRAIVEVLSGREIRHDYEHDAQGRVVGYTDPAGWETSYVHDGAGRLVEVDSPDAGPIMQVFDDAGRLVERVDGLGAVVLWERDVLGRPLDVAGYAPDGTLESLASYAYDVASGHDAGFSAGRVVAVDDDAGSLALVYDARGRVVRRSRIFRAGDREVSLAYARTFDAQGRVVEERFPDGARLQREYGARGLERAVGGFVPEIEHDGYGRWTAMDLGNGVVDKRGLDPLGRVLAHDAAAHGQPLLDLEYAYDAAGLLAAVQDNVGSTAETPALDQVFVHDDLHRLVEATGAYGVLDWRYSDDGNLLEHAGHELVYDDGRPHAAVGLGEQTLQYDRAGRLRSIAGDGDLPEGTWQFDAHGRVVEVRRKDGSRLVNVYDHEGQRAIRRQYDADGTLLDEALYFGPEVEVRGGRLVRWIFAAGQRVAETSTSLPEGGFPIFPAAGVGL